jgi:hypothetical protein
MHELSPLLDDLTQARRHLMNALLRLPEVELNAVRCDGVLSYLESVDQMGVWIRSFLEAYDRSLEDRLEK